MYTNMFLFNIMQVGNTRIIQTELPVKFQFQDKNYF